MGIDGKNKHVVGLVILDGWGIAPVWGGNAITIAQTPVYLELQRKYPHTTLLASGPAVGLPEGAPGNSEAGHLNIGAGTIVHQDGPIIDAAIADGSFFQNKTLLEAVAHAKKNKSNIHLMGLLSKTGTHSQIEHLYALLKLIHEQGYSRVYIHLFSDGRDSETMGGLELIREVEEQCKEIGVGQVESVVGRFYAMDRDNHWDRVSTAYDLLTKGKGKAYQSPSSIFAESYSHGTTDEFVEPSIISNKTVRYEPISNNDSIIFFNFRIDRSKELTEAFLNSEVKEMPSRKKLQNLFFVSFVIHSDYKLCLSAFAPEIVADSIGEVWSKNNLRQYRTAETEKYAHVTYFLNGGLLKPFLGEDDVMILSPENVETYEKVPEMSAEKVCTGLINALNKNIYDAFVINFANADMVGHTGDLKATVKAVECVDKQLGRLYKYIIDSGGLLFVVADHGNAEQMVNPRTSDPDTEHTTNPVPFIIVSDNEKNQQLKLRGDCSLSSVAPTILDLMNIPYDKKSKAPSLIISTDGK